MLGYVKLMVVDELNEKEGINSKPNVIPILNVHQGVFSLELKLVAIVAEGDLAYDVNCDEED